MNVSRRVVGDICGNPVGEVLLESVGRTLVGREEKALFCLMIATYQVAMRMLVLHVYADV
jgi:hypothetical protein